MTAYVADGLAVFLGWSQMLPKRTIETRLRLFVFLERRDRKMYKGSHFGSSPRRLILRRGLILSSGTLGTCWPRLSWEKPRWASHSCIYVSGCWRGSWFCKGSYFKAGVEKEGRAGGPGLWVPHPGTTLASEFCISRVSVLFILGGNEQQAGDCGRRKSS